MIKFEVIKQHSHSSARLGRLVTPRGEIQTPAFMPVGTQATVKALSPEELEQCGAEIILGNTYHLYLRPGHDIVESLGGLHRFMNWDKPILTDSGGFQVFSLNSLAKVTEEGVTFKSHIDGSTHFFSPERAIEVQEALGADIAMTLDEPTPYPSDPSKTETSLKLSTDWAVRCKAAHRMKNQALFGIVQGGMYKNLRKQSTEEITALDFPGYAIGGLSVGEEIELMYDIAAYTAELLPKDKPRYLMGVGTPTDLIENVSRGVDMFDCVMPTRNARNGQLFTFDGKINIRNAKYKSDFSPIDENGISPMSETYTKAYLHHLFKTEEILGYRIATQHNLHFYILLMKTMREEIQKETFESWSNIFLTRYNEGS